MEETPSLWNKTTAELTVKDQLVVAAVVPIVVIGGWAVVAAVVTVSDKIVKKFRKIKPLHAVTNEK